MLIYIIFLFEHFQARSSDVAWPTIPLKGTLDGNCIEFRKVKIVWAEYFLNLMIQLIDSSEVKNYMAEKIN